MYLEYLITSLLALTRKNCSVHLHSAKAELYYNISHLHMHVYTWSHTSFLLFCLTLLSFSSVSSRGLFILTGYWGSTYPWSNGPGVQTSGGSNYTLTPVSYENARIFHLCHDFVLIVVHIIKAILAQSVAQ